MSYTPKEYGKVKVGKLEIQTPELYWSYLLKGTFPKEVIPVAESRIDNKLSPKLLN